jgi:hypothetical protein
MCFSATGSFAISGVLTAVGGASMARNSSAPHRMFAAIPLIFAAQQAAEGIVWLTLNSVNATFHRLAVATFLGVALVVWPMWLPFALRLAERNPARRRWLGVLALIGGAVAVYTSVMLVHFQPTAHVAGHSIRYDYATAGDTATHAFYPLAYALPTVIPFFVSTVKMARLIGVLLIFSLAVSVAVQRDALTSVWCFFAAILSGLILVAVVREQPSPSVARSDRAERR